MFRNMPGKVGRNKSMTLLGQRRYCASVSKSLIQIIDESRMSMANSLEPDDDKSSASKSEAMEPFTPVRKTPTNHV